MMGHRSQQVLAIPCAAWIAGETEGITRAKGTRVGVAAKHFRHRIGSKQPRIEKQGLKISACLLGVVSVAFSSRGIKILVKGILSEWAGAILVRHIGTRKVAIVILSRRVLP